MRPRLGARRNCPIFRGDMPHIVEEIIAMFGPDRAMFASNFPVDSLCGSFDTIYSGFKEIAARNSHADQEFLFCKTAREVYRTREQNRSAPLDAMHLSGMRAT